MFQVCYYKGCGVIYGEKEPFADKRMTHGLCPKHYKISLKELGDSIDKMMDKSGELKVLLVEDNRLFRELFKEALHGRFPKVHIDEAVTGEEALQKIEETHPNIIFMDIKLPGKNGLEVTKKIKTRHPDVIVIILTGYDLPEYREASSRYADYFFSKDSSTTENIFSAFKSILPRPL